MKYAKRTVLMVVTNRHRWEEEEAKIKQLVGFTVKVMTTIEITLFRHGICPILNVLC